MQMINVLIVLGSVFLGGATSSHASDPNEKTTPYPNSIMRNIPNDLSQRIINEAIDLASPQDMHALFRTCSSIRSRVMEKYGTYNVVIFEDIFLNQRGDLRETIYNLDTRTPSFIFINNPNVNILESFLQRPNLAINVKGFFCFNGNVAQKHYIMKNHYGVDVMNEVIEVTPVQMLQNYRKCLTDQKKYMIFNLPYLGNIQSVICEAAKYGGNQLIQVMRLLTPGRHLLTLGCVLDDQLLQQVRSLVRLGERPAFMYVSVSFEVFQEGVRRNETECLVQAMQSCTSQAPDSFRKLYDAIREQSSIDIDSLRSLCERYKLGNIPDLQLAELIGAFKHNRLDQAIELLTNNAARVPNREYNQLIEILQSYHRLDEWDQRKLIDDLGLEALFDIMYIIKEGIGEKNLPRGAGVKLAKTIRAFLAVRQDLSAILLKSAIRGPSYCTAVTNVCLNLISDAPDYIEVPLEGSHFWKRLGEVLYPMEPNLVLGFLNNLAQEISLPNRPSFERTKSIKIAELKTREQEHVPIQPSESPVPIKEMPEEKPIAAAVKASPKPVAKPVIKVNQIETNGYKETIYSKLEKGEEALLHPHLDEVMSNIPVYLLTTLTPLISQNLIDLKTPEERISFLNTLARVPQEALVRLTLAASKEKLYEGKIKILGESKG